MTRKTIFGILIPLLAVLHFFLHVGLGIKGAAPDLLTLALLLAARETGMGGGGALGFFFGLLEDAFPVLTFGANTLAMTVIGILGARTRDLFVGDSLLFFFVYLSSGKLLRDMLHWVVAGEGMREPFVNAVLIDGGIAALYMALVGVLLLALSGGTRGLRWDWTTPSPAGTGRRGASWRWPSSWGCWAWRSSERKSSAQMRGNSNPSPTASNSCQCRLPGVLYSTAMTASSPTTCPDMQLSCCPTTRTPFEPDWNASVPISS